MKEQPIYRVIFSQEDKVYEVYARYISEESLMGFIEVEEVVFTESSTIVLNPSEERLKTEFNGVKRSYIPMHMILRIDEMVKKGPSKIKEPLRKKGNIHHLPAPHKQPLKDKE